MFRRILSSVQFYLLPLYLPLTALAQDIDKGFDTSVKSPIYASNGPIIVIDNAHYNLSNDDSYGPLYKLLKADGYDVKHNSNTFSVNSLKDAQILVIINPRGGRYLDKEQSVFVKDEANIIVNWIKNGGSLLLIIDNFYSVSASKNLLASLKIRVSGGTVTDSKNFYKPSMRREHLIFSRNNDLLSNHAITKGRNQSEEVSTVCTFNGTSLTASTGSTNILKLSEFAKESQPDSAWTSGKGLFKQTYVRFNEPVSVEGQSQGLSLDLGKGRIVVLGDGSMLTALTIEGQKQGMNTGDNHNKQFALNIFHWLSRII